MKNAIILHGTNGSPDGNWFRWLEAELQAKGFNVWLPQLPHAESPSLREWLDFIRSDCPFGIDKDTLIVGHSSGATLALVLANELDQSFGGVVAVAPFIPTDALYIATTWINNKRLFDVEINLTKTLKQARQNDGKPNVIILHSDDDPYIPQSVAERVARLSGAELVVFPGQGHFNLEQSSSYRTFPELAEIVQERFLWEKY